MRLGFYYDSRDDGLPVPALWDIDLENGIIVMQKMNGRPLIDILRDEKTSEKDLRGITQFRICGQIAPQDGCHSRRFIDQ